MDDAFDAGVVSGFKDILCAFDIGLLMGLPGAETLTGNVHGGIGNDRVAALERGLQRGSVIQVSFTELDALVGQERCLGRGAYHAHHMGAGGQQAAAEVGTNHAAGAGDGDGFALQISHDGLLIWVEEAESSPPVAVNAMTSQRVLIRLRGTHSISVIRSISSPSVVAYQ